MERIVLDTKQGIEKMAKNLYGQGKSKEQVTQAIGVYLKQVKKTIHSK